MIEGKELEILGLRTLLLILNNASRAPVEEPAYDQDSL